MIMIYMQAAFNPIGIVIGMFLVGMGNLIIAIFLSLSVGTFLYVATMEVLGEVFEDKKYRW